MSGLCGWVGYGQSIGENQQITKSIVQVLTRFDHSRSQTYVNGNSSLAIAASEQQLHYIHKNDFIAGIWGHAKFSNDALNQLSSSQGIASVLVDQWVSNGPDAIEGLLGEFICCLINVKSHEVFIAVDRMGTRPLYYQILENGLLFGTSLDAMMKHPLAKDEISAQGIYDYIYFHMVPGPNTIYRESKCLLPGEYIYYKQGKLTNRHYWNAQFKENEVQSFSELKQNFISLLHTSVKDTITGYQHVGAFLSGGTDSSTIAGILQEVTGKPAKTFSIGFDAPGYDEMDYARIAARYFSTSHHEYYVTPEDVAAAIPQIAAVFDQPFGNASAIPSFYCAQMARKDGIELLLGGDGGDELFGGNVRYAKQYVFSLYERIPSVLREKIITPLVLSTLSGTNTNPLRKIHSYISKASIPMPHRMETYNLLIRYGYQDVFTQDFLLNVDINEPASQIERTYHKAETASLINRMLAYDWKYTLTDNDLPKVTKACELAAVDVAYPFLNNEMVSFSEKLRPELKLKKTKLRYFFKEALRDFLPEEIITKQKHGFGLPFGVWLQENKLLQTQAADCLTDLKKRHIFRADFIDKILGQYLYQHASYHGTMVWLLMMLECWYKQRSR